jgi:2-(1,2-epoxy-1,2-dihydrophenyl)acetyl-CoA isomerase
MKANVALALTTPLDEYRDVEVTHHLATFPRVDQRGSGPAA